MISNSQVMAKCLKTGDAVSAFAFDKKLFPLKMEGKGQENLLNVETADSDKVYSWLSTYFKFLRTKITAPNREYYVNLLDAVNESEREWRKEGELPDGYPVYIIMAVFGSHLSVKESAFRAMAKVLGSDMGNKVSLGSQKESTYTQLQNMVNSQMVNFMLLTSCMEEVKKEKILQIVSYAKRSLVVDIKAEKNNLAQLLTDFVN
jgi:hypothetical protein